MIRKAFLLCLILVAIKVPAQLKTFSQSDRLYRSDWLVKPVKEKAEVYKSGDRKDIILYNGLVKRTFRLVTQCCLY